MAPSSTSFASRTAVGSQLLNRQTITDFTGLPFVGRLCICLYPGHVRPTEEVRVSLPRLLQRETLWPSASEHSPRPSTFGASAD